MNDYLDLTTYTPRHAKQNFALLNPYITAALNTADGWYTFTTNGYEPLVIEPVGTACGDYPVLAIKHYYIQMGDVMNDPEITFAYDEDGKRILPLSFDSSGTGYHRHIIDFVGESMQKNFMREQSDFLYMWAQNIIAQGFDPEQPSYADSGEEVRTMSIEDFEALVEKGEVEPITQ